MAFAKLFEVGGFGQVLAKLGTDDEGRPELRWFAELPELGVCEFALGFDDDDGWEKAEAAFDQADTDAAMKAAVTLWKVSGNTVPPNVLNHRTAKAQLFDGPVDCDVGRNAAKHWPLLSRGADTL